MSDDELYEITCPHCQAKFRKSLQWLKQRNKQCDECKISFKADEFMREIEEIERKIQSIQEKIEKLA
jgi:hypothetical protein